MSFESVRGYLQLASGLGELTRARATEAAQGMLSLPGVGVATGKLAVQVGALADELLAAAKTNREHLTTLVRSEVEAAVTRLGLGTAEKLEESQAEVSRLRAEVASLRLALARSTTGAVVGASAAKQSSVKQSAPKQSAVKKSAVKEPAVKEPAVKQSAVKKSAVKKSAVKKSAVKEPAVKEPAVKQSAVKQSAVKKSAVKKSAVKKSAVKKSGAAPASAVTTSKPAET